jgi:hypothetical protein
MNSSSISKAIKASTRIDKSTTARGRVSDVTSEGYISQQMGEIVKVSYVASSLGYSDKGWEIYQERQHGALYLIGKILRRKGYAVEQIGNLLQIKESK